MVDGTILAYTKASTSVNGTIDFEGRRVTGGESIVQNRHTRVAGDIKTFSRASARRLRHLMMFARPAGCVVRFPLAGSSEGGGRLDPSTALGRSDRGEERREGTAPSWRGVQPPTTEGREVQRTLPPAYSILCVTLTMPDELPRDPDLLRGFLGRVDAAWNWWQYTLRRKFPRVGWFWRVELQKRLSVHWHMVGLVPDGATVDEGEIRRLWSVFCERLREGMSSHRGFARYAVDITWRDDIAKSTVYLSAHTSKHKVEQLGWIGRQWGVINRAALSFEPVNVARVEPWEVTQYKRTLRKLYKARLWLIRDFRSPGNGKIVILGDGRKCYYPSRRRDYLERLLRGRVAFGKDEVERLLGFSSGLGLCRHMVEVYRHGLGHVTDAGIAVALRTVHPALVPYPTPSPGPKPPPPSAHPGGIRTGGGEAGAEGGGLVQADLPLEMPV